MRPLKLTMRDLVLTQVYRCWILTAWEAAGFT